MIHFNGNFVGYKPNTVSKFCGSDNEEKLNKHLKVHTEDWYYRNVDITYNYNKNGHRCKNIEEIDLDNYILFSGCSHVEGVGVELEKSFPYLVADELGIDYYNLGLGGSGIDVMTYNLVSWLNTVKKLPKAVVIMWTYEARFAIIHPNKLTFHLPGNTNPRSGKFMNMTDAGRFMGLGNDIDYFNSKKIFNSKMVKSCYSETTLIELETDDFVYYDSARDLMHYGIISQQILAKKILNKLKREDPAMPQILQESDRATNEIQ
jgi:hypothetical protein